ncbi:thrombospondin type-1 domain-containing protein 4-like [Megalops cyprinoides]|uniref:thrombospondin type-1 domain-containing protein 4-like n=1 Tax=Megalops cyprinoides TaxID=118141 RepID=UPI001863B5F2|nr:thrombospondin type-1 domain-containing protein 4-like [Megalops cyprinoides]
MASPWKRTACVAFLALCCCCLRSGALPWDTVAKGSPGEDSGCEGHQVDACGVCEGDGSSCEVVSGTFSRSTLSVGYHKILEIPVGAKNIKIQELTKSRNYLAILTRDGESVISGSWAIDRPGVFFAAGTQLTYRRPNEIRSRAGESIAAPGPTTQELHVYVIYQQPDPSVSYQYILPRVTTHNSQPAPPSHILPLGETMGLHTIEGEGFSLLDNNGNENSHPNQVPSDPLLSPTTESPGAQVGPEQLSPYGWKRTGSTLCSATCGTGRHQSVFSCVELETSVPVPDSLCEHTQRPVPQEEDCNTQLCPAFWDVGEWSECSKSCGPGTQHRQVLCRQPLANGSVVPAGPRRCRHLEQPETSASCQLKICSEWQIRSEWTSCSVPCGVGQSVRDVKCVDNLGDVVPDEDCNMKLRPEDLRNCDMGPCARSWFFTHWSDRCSAECGEGIRSRTVVCLMNHISSLPLEGCGDERPDDRMPCDLGPCQHKPDWYTGPWGQCSSECSTGTQSRSVVCLLHSNGSFEVAPPSDCAHLPRPADTQQCHLKRCGAKWYVTEWSSCSRSCEGGYQVREVRCLADDMTESRGCDPFLMPEDREECNTQPCVPEIDESCQDMYYNCNVVVQASLCVYSYYRTACCASCRRVSGREGGLPRR